MTSLSEYKIHNYRFSITCVKMKSNLINYNLNINIMNFLITDKVVILMYTNKEASSKSSLYMEFLMGHSYIPFLNNVPE